MDADLPTSLAAFCRVLNRERGFHVGPRELVDAARALELSRIGDEASVRDMLRPVLCMNHDQALAFDSAFRTFFLGRRQASTEEQPQAPRRRAESDASRRTPATAHLPGPTATGEFEGAADLVVATATSDVDSEAEPTPMRGRYSPLRGVGDAPAGAGFDAAWRDAARAFVRQLEGSRARRWRPARRGPRLDFRRTLRNSLHTAGDVLQPRWRARTRRRPRFVMLIDGSRSMSVAAERALTLAIALSAATPGVETFAFSTSLRRITPLVQQAAAGADAAWPPLGEAWGGGTSIGTSLAAFVREADDRMLSKHTVVILASDGLDTGEPDTLRQVLSGLHQRSAALIWLNPLLESADYEAIALGMRTARPYISMFTWIAQPADLATLGRTVRLRS